MIDWANLKTTRGELETINKIANRVLALGVPVEKTSMMMDLEACHSIGCPLDLPAMLTAADTDLVHDVCGIGRHLDRDTGKLMDCFVPRLALRV